MKGITLAAAVLAALTMTAVWAEDIAPAPVTPAPGSPGTATPTPYPQITPRTPPKPGEPLPSIELPSPPKDQTLPGLEQHDKADKAKPVSS
ncbi:hypothetical protein NLK61_21325 [Pseudomonas fuscovaginae UPB0736]|uniref:Uncharacterized protein n=1 Tax=Pseudomonas asplenii TaxID=53407 RepID=A0A1H6PC13_9PSED|nr:MULTISPECIES: hypothetical protein [Pseudomonas]UUQ63773.1 hypothetical protein NLK61_21325 [Pseudomonas fuscovaginae UPB0736]UZE27738.1 hypothetical protein LOY63_20600 [Pseudomonas asplenii]SDS86274.1 hypothetical protein SAMN05216598_3041 [Pseudomonas asplenii]SEI24380.1 hypothetical protein SAMN05216581_5479 [Pseudomonas fuscovaginae]